MEELHDWIEKYKPVVMHIRPTPGTDERSYGQLVKLLRDKGGVSHRFTCRSRPLMLLTVCHGGLGDSGKGHNYDEPSHRAVLTGPPWCGIPNHWDARAPNAAAGSRPAPENL